MDENNVEYMRGRLDALKDTVTQHWSMNDARFSRLETKIDGGFEKTQLDREKGNKAIGDLIAKNAEISQVTHETVIKNQAQLKTLIAVMTIAAPLVLWLLDHFFVK